MPTDFYTFRNDIRPRGDGSPVSYKPLAALTDLCMGEFVGFDGDDKALVRYRMAQEKQPNNPQIQQRINELTGAAPPQPPRPR